MHAVSHAMGNVCQMEIIIIPASKTCAVSCTSSGIYQQMQGLTRCLATNSGHVWGRMMHKGEEG